MFAMILSFCSFRARARVVQIWGPRRPFQARLRASSEAARLPRMIQKPLRSSCPSEAPQASRCARCGDAFECGARAGREPCWCGEFPALSAPTPGSGCYCPRCLQRGDRNASKPRTARLSPYGRLVAASSLTSARIWIVLMVLSLSSTLSRIGTRSPFFSGRFRSTSIM